MQTDNANAAPIRFVAFLVITALLVPVRGRTGGSSAQPRKRRGRGGSSIRDGWHVCIVRKKTGRILVRLGMRFREFLGGVDGEQAAGRDGNGRKIRSALRGCALSCLAGLLALTGCGQFFPPLSTGTGTGSNTGDYIYAGNLGTSPVTVAGFAVSSSAFSVISGSPWTVNLAPTALAITPNNDYLYVGSAAGDIYVYTIASDGVIAIGNNGSPVASGVEPSVLRVDPTGAWLLGADALTGEAYVFQIGTDGALTSISSSLVTLNASVAATDLEISPNENYVFVSCGTAGIYTLSFDSSTGAMAQVNSVLTPKQTGDADYGMAVDTSGAYLLAAETGIGAVRVFSISSTNGTLTEVSGSPYTTGTGAYSVLVDSTDTYVYVANRTVGNISAFTLSTTGTLTAVSGSPFTTGKLPEEMVEDSSDTYIAVVCAGGSPDIQLFTISSTTPGALTSFETGTTGTDPTEASAIAATH
jgi:6-phosphogluconolactonase